MLLLLGASVSPSIQKVSFVVGKPTTFYNSRSSQAVTSWPSSQHNEAAPGPSQAQTSFQNIIVPWTYLLMVRTLVFFGCLTSSDPEVPQFLLYALALWAYLLIMKVLDDCLDADDVLGKWFKSLTKQGRKNCVLALTSVMVSINLAVSAYSKLTSLLIMSLLIGLIPTGKLDRRSWHVVAVTALLSPFVFGVTLNFFTQKYALLCIVFVVFAALDEWVHEWSEQRLAALHSEEASLKTTLKKLALQVLYGRNLLITFGTLSAFSLKMPAVSLLCVADGYQDAKGLRGILLNFLNLPGRLYSQLFQKLTVKDSSRSVSPFDLSKV